MIQNFQLRMLEWFDVFTWVNANLIYLNNGVESEQENIQEATNECKTEKTSNVKLKTGCLFAMSFFLISIKRRGS